MFLAANLTIILFYGFAFVLANTTDITLPLNIAGLAWLLLVTPYNLTKLFHVELTNGIEKYFSWLTLFFFLFAPVYSFAHGSFGFSIDQMTVLFINLGVFAVVCGKVFMLRGEQIYFFLPRIRWKSLFVRHRLLIVGLVLFAATHAINYSFTVFIPEVDSYGPIRAIERHVDGEEEISGGRRHVFLASTTTLSAFSNTEPYTLFSFWMVALQSTLVIAVYAFFRVFGIRNRLFALLLIATAVAVPVINLETDIIRAQTLYILAFPIWAYFLYRALTTKYVTYWIYAGIISVFGMLYHEFFFFLIVVYASILFGVLFRQYLLRAEDGKDRVIFSLAIVVGVLLVNQFAQRLRAVQFVLNFAENRLTRMTNISNWELWFLDTYATDVEGMGWPGWWGAAQYYGYYFSPALIVLFIVLVVLIPTLWKNVSTRGLLVILAPLLAVYLVFAEVLPRVNVPYLPERFWLLITMTLVLLAVPLWAGLERWCPVSVRRVGLVVYTILLVIGISGSFYVAQSKGAVTSRAEHAAAMWMRENTPEDAVFITQRKNKLMVKFFGRRTWLIPQDDFFLGDEVISVTASDTMERSVPSQSLEQIMENKKQIEREIERLREFEASLSSEDNEKQSILILLDEIAALVSSVEVQIGVTQDIERRLEISSDINEKDREHKDPPLYILYSEDKFNTLYAQREWWLESNFYGASLEKFDEVFSVVYDRDEVKIWEMNSE